MVWRHSNRDSIQTTPGASISALKMDRHHDKLTLRGRIIGLKEGGMSAPDIAVEFGVSESTVYKWWKRWLEEGNLRDHPRSGAPKKTAAVDQRILAAVAENPMTNAVALRDDLQLQVSVCTVRNRLHKAGVHHRIPAKKEKLTERHRLDRLRFAQRYVQEDMQFWGRAIFSDEKTFSSSTYGRHHCWRPNGTRYAPENIHEVTRSGYVTCNVWGWLHLYGIGELVDIEGRFTAETYLEILEDVMLPSVRAMALPYPERIVFVQVRETNVA